jgi:hypothetical protein
MLFPFPRFVTYPRDRGEDNRYRLKYVRGEGVGSASRQDKAMTTFDPNVDSEQYCLFLRQYDRR